MLAKRIIPTVLCRGRQLVKGRAFDAWRTVGMATQAVKIHQARGVDELILLDIAATPENRGPDLDMVRELTANCFMPLTVGGGVRILGDVRELLEAGADKVAVRTYWQNIEPMARAVGCQAIVGCIDVTTLDNNPAPASEATIAAAVTRARAMANLGAGEILITRCEREATLCGYDIGLVSAVAAAVDIPVIAHGGCGTYEHMREAIEAGASAVAAGAIFQFTECTPKGAAEYLADHGVEVRR